MTHLTELGSFQDCCRICFGFAELYMGTCITVYIDDLHNVLLKTPAFFSAYSFDVKLAFINLKPKEKQ